MTSLNATLWKEIDELIYIYIYIYLYVYNIYIRPVATLMQSQEMQTYTANSYLNTVAIHTLNGYN